MGKATDLNNVESGWKTLGALPLYVATTVQTLTKPLILLNGGAEGSRTPDLLIANETLYQLSYDPIHEPGNTYNVFPKSQDPIVRPTLFSAGVIFPFESVRLAN